MEKEQRNRLQKATQDARKLLEEEFRSQLLRTYDIDVERVRWAEEPGAHLQAEQRLIREKLVAWIEHKEGQINDRKEALLLALREMAFTALNRFVALKLMEARELVRPCVSGGLESAGFLEFTAVAQGLVAEQESSYRLYLETIFEDVSRELRALFDPRDPASLLWPKRTALLELLVILNRSELAELWSEDETLGWVYQYFNGDAERKKMREESAAPRNSRELAVRNQFFTPRYVVEFLTDNTLGRIWYEMRQGNTGLKDRCRYLVRRPNEIWLQLGEKPPAHSDGDEALSQEELLHQPVHIPHRPLKDPREIRMLDPACGSMHFGLYAFDLYLEIYKEAWEIAQGSDEQSKQEEIFSPFVAYAAGFDSKSAFLREVPRLILMHNIHGVDIDPRATQIARLTLWLRAQRAWKEQRLEVADRPPITRSNVVCAEPMPGERHLLADFVDQQFPDAERGLVQQLLETIFGKMLMAGETGSLLKIEEEIHDAINQARRDWQKLAIQQQDLFSSTELAALGGAGSSLNADLQHLTKDFWLDIEERIYSALRDYANQAKSDSYQRRLFAEDAAQGFAFIDVCRKRYDVVEMNPPFGAFSTDSKRLLEAAYPFSRSDIYGSFIERGIQLLADDAFLGAITNRTGFFLKAFQEWRANFILPNASPRLFADLGSGVLDAALVETAAYCLKRGGSSEEPTTFFRIIGSDDRGADLLELCRNRTSNHSNLIFEVSPKSFKSIPGAPFAYWAPRRLLESFSRLPAFQSEERIAAAGGNTGDNFRFVRTAWETPSSSKQHWIPYSKGGHYSPYYFDTHLCINWQEDGLEMKSFLIDYRSSKGWSPNWTAELHGSEHYGRKGLTWPRRTSSPLSVRALPSGCVFGDKGPAVFVENDNSESLLSLLVLMNSKIFHSMVDLQISNADSAARSYEVGIIQKTPVPHLDKATEKRISTLALKIWKNYQSLDLTSETTHAFKAPIAVSHLDGLTASASAWNSRLSRLRREIECMQAAADLEVSSLYAIEDSSRQADAPRSVDQELKEVRSEEVDVTVSWLVEVNDVATDLASYLLGCSFGRWDIRCATGEKQAPEPLDPFAPLQACPPGQLQNKQALPACPEDLSEDYPIRILWDGLVVDDPNHPLDIELHLREALKIIWIGHGARDNAVAIEHEACGILGVKTLRDYFRKPAGFFADHLKRYSKSRRQAPIYWQLSVGNGNYSAWLYYHRFTQDTLYRLLRDFVEPRIQKAERDQFELESQSSLSGDAAIRLLEAQTLLQDLQIFKSELDLVAPLWNPNLNDGVIINHAILWRITPYTPWQKKCKECWDKLVKGDYDWAHLAFHLWPERVIPKCTTDRSLAIAHGLEERLWQEINNGNWLPRQLSEAELNTLINEHTKPAVKNALEGFLAAPPPVAPTRTRATRATRSSTSGTTRKPRGSATMVDAEATRQALLALTAAPAEGLSRNAIAELLGVEAASLTAVIKRLKETGQIEQLGAARGARYVLTEAGRAAVASETEVDA